MSKYSVIAILLAVVIGFTAGFSLSGSQKNKEIAKLMKQHEQELLKQNENSKHKIDSVRTKIVYIEKQLQQDSVTIKALKYQIKADGIRYKKELDKIKNLTPHEKAVWLNSRYSNTDSVQH